MPITRILPLLLLLFSSVLTNAQTWSRSFLFNPYISGGRYAYDTSAGGIVGINRQNPHETKLIRFDNAGNELWSQMLDVDTLQYTSLDDIYTLPDGNYMAVVSGVDAFFDSYFYLIRYSSNGTLLSKKKILNYYDSHDYSRQFISGDNFYYEISRRDTQYSYWDNVQMDYLDSGDYRSYVKKYDQNNNLIWSYDFSYVWGGYNNNGYPDQMGISPGNGCLFNDGGLLLVKNFDTLFFPNPSAHNSIMERLDPSANVLWTVDFHLVLGLSSGVRAQASRPFVTSDSSIVIVVFKMDSIGSWQVDGPEILKFNSSGNLIGHISLPNGYFMDYGSELQNGNYIFAVGHDDPNTNGYDTYGIAIYDNNLNYLSYNPMPFVDPFFLSDFFIPNQYGGAFCAYRSTLGDDHMFAVNFDSLFNVYPAQFPGDITLDMNNNCQVNTGDIPVTTSPVKMTDANNVDYYSFSDLDGHYNADVPLGNYTVSQPVAPNKQVLCPSGGTYNYTFSTPGIYTQSDFYDSYIPNLTDIALSFYPSVFVPGYSSTVNVVVSNTGSVVVGTTATITLPPNTQFNGSVPVPSGISGNTFTYNVSGLQPDSSFYIVIDLTVDQTTQVGSLLTITGSAPLNNDLTPADNNDDLTSVVVGSFDPNDKSVNRPPVCYPDEALTYRVRFQNTGTYQAKNVVVVDTISNKLDMSTFKLLSASPSMPEVSWSEGNKLTFTFADIYLPDSNTNEPASHGDFVYSIMPKTTANYGDSILNTAYIFFDFNLAVVTNTTVNTIGWPSSVKEVVGNENFTLFPNPVTDILSIKTDAYSSYKIMSILGHSLLEGSLKNGETRINVKSLPTGIYSITLSGVNGQKAMKLQKL